MLSTLSDTLMPEAGVPFVLVQPATNHVRLHRCCAYCRQSNSLITICLDVAKLRTERQNYFLTCMYPTAYLEIAQTKPNSKHCSTAVCTGSSIHCVLSILSAVR
jgi:hypothetical protein